MVTITVEDDERKTVYTADDILATIDYGPWTGPDYCSRPKTSLEFVAAFTMVTHKAQLGETFIDDNEIVYMKADSREDVYKILGRIDTLTQTLVWISGTGDLVHALPARAKRWPKCSG